MILPKARKAFSQILVYVFEIMFFRVGDLFEKEFAPWPLRFYVAAGGKMRWISQPVNGFFSLQELETAAKAIINNQSP